MQTQFQTEETQDPIYTPPVTIPADLAGQETTEHIAKEANEAINSSEVTPAVHQWLAKIQQKALRDKKRFWTFFIIMELSTFVTIYIPGLIPFTVNGKINPWALTLPFLPALGMLLMSLKIFLTKPGWNAEEMTRLGGVQAVGPLIDLIQSPKSPRQVPPLYVALTKLLPLMKASDAALLTKGQRDMLYWVLKNGFNAAAKPGVYLGFRLAILRALEQIGDAAAIPIVTTLANGRARTANQKALKAAAQECLPLLQSNFGSVEATKTLLRASQPLPAAPEMLLRPAEFIPDANPKTLLRPADTAP